MLAHFKKWWKLSSLRFYILNTVWNYKFWIFSKKVYRTINHTIDIDEYEMDNTFKLKPKKKNISSKRFSGYMYKNAIYHDNPGIQGIDSETWMVWRRKGLIK